MTDTTSADLDRLVAGQTVARAFVDLLGREPHRIVLMMRNIAEFHAVDMAALMCGATPISVYNSSAPEQVEYLVNHCEARVAVLQDDGFLAKFTAERDQLPSLKTIAVLHPDAARPGELSWDDLVAHEPADLAEASQVGAAEHHVGVPRIWEKFNAGVMAAIAQDPEKAAKFDEAVETARPLALKAAWGEASDDELATLKFLDDAAFRPIRELLGLDHLDVAISGAAPIPRPLLEWYQAIGVPLSEIYGMSESSGLMTWTPYRIKPGTVGPAVLGCEIALADDGEIICRGGNVFTGYLNDPEKTAEALDPDGWLHSGDIGVVDDDGYYRIVDRKKELIITAGGKNISPANLEAALETIPLVGQACAIGDERPFVSALLVLDPDTAPQWARQHDIAFDSLDELSTNPAVIAEIDAGLAQAMENFNNTERVKKVKILGAEWLPDSELLTPTSKLKRRGVNAVFADEIEQLYAR